MKGLEPRPAEECRWDLVALGEVMLRLDPRETPIARTRSFQAWEGGGEYNVARGLRRCFELRTAIVTALAQNPVGELIEDLMFQGGVDQSNVVWVPYDGVGRTVRNGLNFTERGFGVRAALGCSDRGNSAASQLSPGDIDWERIFGEYGARWFHTGGVFTALSQTTAEVAAEAIEAARRHGTIVSYDLNYRPSLWQEADGDRNPSEVSSPLVEQVDVLFGNEEDFLQVLGFEHTGFDSEFLELDIGAYDTLLSDVMSRYPNVKAATCTLRKARTATVNDWNAVCRSADGFKVADGFERLEILDRVGGGDSFAAGFIYGLLTAGEVEAGLAYGIAHSALAMTTPGDTSMATRENVERLFKRGSVRVQR